MVLSEARIKKETPPAFGQRAINVNPTLRASPMPNICTRTNSIRRNITRLSANASRVRSARATTTKNAPKGGYGAKRRRPDLLKEEMLELRKNEHEGYSGISKFY